MIADEPGWQVGSSWIEGPATGAEISKDGVILEFCRVKSDNEDSVRLEGLRHPQVGIKKILTGIGVELEIDGYFTQIADNLPAVKLYLSNPELFQRRFPFELLVSRIQQLETAASERNKRRLWFLITLLLGAIGGIAGWRL